MKRAYSIKELNSQQIGTNYSTSGLVPTMGALHNGHMSIVLLAIKQCKVVTVSIFVNPTQFDDGEDFNNYPRNLEKDIEMLSGVMRENDIVFIPDTHEIYPEEDTRIFSFGNLDKVMEGLHRPGHFNGVAQVVSRLFDIIKPDIAYFGQKDFQQLTIIRELVRQTGNKVKIISCPVIRESDGLAMSSRNQLLKPEIRKKACIIYITISKAAWMIKTMEITDIKEFVITNINLTPHFSLDYFEIADDVELVPVRYKSEIKKNRKYFACIAVNAGKVRLIDNIEISLSE